MSLKYSFREVFRRKILRPKRLWALLEDLDSRIGEGGGSSSPSLDDLDLELVEAVITYKDESTETVQIPVHKSSGS